MHIFIIVSVVLLSHVVILTECIQLCRLWEAPVPFGATLYNDKCSLS